MRIAIIVCGIALFLFGCYGLFGVGKRADEQMERIIRNMKKRDREYEDWIA